jgi:hypothetical protein
MLAGSSETLPVPEDSTFQFDGELGRDRNVPIAADKMPGRVALRNSTVLGLPGIQLAARPER